MAMATESLKALAAAKGGSPAKPKTLMMGKAAGPAPKATSPASPDIIKTLTKHAPTIESALEDKAGGKFSIKDKPTAQDVALAKSVYEALPAKVKQDLAPLAGISLARAIVLADELADAKIIEDHEPMTAFLFLAGQLIPAAEQAAGEEA